jgi:hypothetical protein
MTVLPAIFNLLFKISKQIPCRPYLATPPPAKPYLATPFPCFSSSHFSYILFIYGKQKPYRPYLATPPFSDCGMYIG